MALPTSDMPPRMAFPATSGVEHGSYIDWPVILAGAVLAAALSFVLITFGSGLGLSMISPEPNESVSLRWITLATGLWFVWVAVSSFAAGGYFAGRMRRRIGDAVPDEVEARDGGHGLMVWAVGSLLATVMAVSGVSGLVGTAVSSAGSAAGGVATAMQSQVENYASTALRGETGKIVPPEVRAEVASVLSRSLTDGEVTEPDRVYLSRIIAEQTGQTPEQARTAIDTTITEAQAAWQQAVDTAEQVRIAGVIATFLVAATMLISAVAAYTMATLGGKHRDENTSFRTAR